MITVGLYVHQFIFTLTEVTVILTCRFQAVRFMFLFDCFYSMRPSIEQKVGILCPNQLKLKMCRINMKYQLRLWSCMQLNFLCFGKLRNREGQVLMTEKNRRFSAVKEHFTANMLMINSRFFNKF